MSDRVCRSIAWFLLAMVLLLPIGHLFSPSSTANPPYGREIKVPQYGVGYSQSEELLKEILTELKGLREDVRNGRPAATNDPLVLVKSRCGACHSADVADEKGASFVMLEKDGKLAPLSLAEKRRVKRMLDQRKMPPSAPLSDAEKQLVLAHLLKE